VKLLRSATVELETDASQMAWFADAHEYARQAARRWGGLPTLSREARRSRGAGAPAV